MTARVTHMGMILILAASGCVSDEQKLTAVPNSPFAKPIRTQSASIKQAPQATQQASMRVMQLGQKIVAANPRLGKQVAFMTIGSSEPEIFHQAQKEGGVIYVTEGLVNQCKSENELAAALCQELGKMSSEKAAKAASPRSLPSRPPLISPRIGNDIGGAFGPADGSEQMILARAEKDRRQAEAALPPPPESLARTYMQSAGFDPKDLATVAPLLRKSDQNGTLQQSMMGR